MVAPSISDLLTHAVTLHQRGHVRDAATLYEQIITRHPAHFDALHLAGVAAQQLGDFDRSADLLARALQRDTNFAAAHNNYAITLQNLGRYDEALASYERALALDSNIVEAHTNRGVVLQMLGRDDDARQSLEHAIKLRPEFAEAHHNLGTVFHEINQLDDALACYERALALCPNYAEAHYNRANVWHVQGRLDAAYKGYSDAITHNPAHANAWYNRANTARALGRLEAALGDYERALAIAPGHAEAWNNRGNCLKDLRRPDAARLSYEHAFAANPAHAEAYNNHGICLRELGQAQAALHSFERALALKPDYAEAHANGGHAHTELKQLEAALACYEAALNLDPDAAYVRGMRLHTQMQLCDWRDWAQASATLATFVKHGGKASPPFPLLALIDEPSLHHKAAQVWAHDKHPMSGVLGTLPRRRRDSKIRIGYFSAGFHDHALSYLMAELFEQHDKTRFEWIAFSFGPDVQDTLRRRVTAAFDRFIDVRGTSDLDVARLAREHRIDIAVDLMGYTQDYRLGIFAARAAPVQVSYLGYPGTLGAPYIDYIIADRVVIPAPARQHFTEKIAWLPHSYQANDTQRERPSREFTRTELGLPEKAFVYSCFNSTFKITPRVFDSWMRILARTEGSVHSVLWLYADNDTAKNNLRAEAQRRGVDPARLIFGTRVSTADHAARQRMADVFLDTWPYGSHTTASDALWLGVPVVTCTGTSFASRVGSSLLEAVGLPGLSAHSTDDFERIAISLAADPSHLAYVREKLAQARKTSPLFDTPRFTRDLEAVYEAMMKRYDAGQAPEHIE